MKVADLLLKTAILCIIITMLSSMALIVAQPALADAGNATATPVPEITPTPDATPTLIASPTPTPAPLPRTVFSSSPRWDNDHVSIMVTNTGNAIQVVSYIDTPDDNQKIDIAAGTSRRVSTPSINAENGQIIVFGFKAYENGTLIDFKDGTVTAIVTVSPTSMPETASISGMVTDAINGEPLIGAEVIFTSKNYDKQYPMVITDQYGVYTSPKMVDDVYLITIKMDSYKPVINLMTNGTVTGHTNLDAIRMEKLTGPATPTPAPTPTASPVPTSPIDAWTAPLYSPTTCIATMGGAVGLLVSLTVIYEWIQRQKDRRKEEKK